MNKLAEIARTTNTQIVVDLLPALFGQVDDLDDVVNAIDSAISNLQALRAELVDDSDIDERIANVVRTLPDNEKGAPVVVEALGDNSEEVNAKLAKALQQRFPDSDVTVAGVKYPALNGSAVNLSDMTLPELLEFIMAQK